MITLQNVTKEYQKGSIGLDNVSLEVDKGEFAFIVGKRVRQDNTDQAAVKGTGSDIRGYRCQRLSLPEDEAEADSVSQETNRRCFPGFPTA